MRRVQEEEVAKSQATVEVDVAMAKPDLSCALSEIRAQYESLAAGSVEECTNPKFANLN